MLPSKIANALIDYLQKVVPPFTLGRWTYRNLGVPTNKDVADNIIDYRADFENGQKEVFRIKIWFNDGGLNQYGFPAHKPSHWFIRTTRLKPHSQIHNIDLEIDINHTQKSSSISILHESFVKLANGIMTREIIQQNFPCLKDDIAIIDSSITGWEAKLIINLLDHELCRVKVKDSL